MRRDRPLIEIISVHPLEFLTKFRTVVISSKQVSVETLLFVVKASFSFSFKFFPTKLVELCVLGFSGVAFSMVPIGDISFDNIVS